MVTFRPSVSNLKYLMRKCAKENRVTCSLQLHVQMRCIGVEGHTELGNHLLSMLVHVGNMDSAVNIFDSLLYRLEMSADVLIKGYIKLGKPRLALALYHNKQMHSLHLSGHTFVALLKVCIKVRDVQMGFDIHKNADRMGLTMLDPFLGSTLVDMYVKFGLVEESQNVFNNLISRNVVTWNAMIAGYVQHKHYEEVLLAFNLMQREGVLPDAITFTCVLKACSKIKAFEIGTELHSEICRRDYLKTDVYIASTLINLYIECGLIGKAHEVLNRCPIQDVVSWNTLISGYVQHGHGEEALNCFALMQDKGIFPNAITFACILKACSITGNIDKGGKVHDEVVRNGLLKHDIFVGNMLVEMYAKCSMAIKAQEVFNLLPSRNVVTWTALLGGYAQQGEYEEVLNCMEKMQEEGISPDIITYFYGLDACSATGRFDEGVKMHCEIERMGLLKIDSFLGTALVDMYANFGSVARAHDVFDILAIRDTVMWNALIEGYLHQDCAEEAINCFEQMGIEGVIPDDVTFSTCLKACGSISAVEKGTEIYSEIMRNGFLEQDVCIGGALVDMYVKCSDLANAEIVFDLIPTQDVFIWNSLIAGYVQNDFATDGLICFQEMQMRGVLPDNVTFTYGLLACGFLLEIHKGLELHSQIKQVESLNSDAYIGSALIDMYVKLGSLFKVEQVFGTQSTRSVASWNSLIKAYVEHECGTNALACFELMQLESMSPSVVTYNCIMKACVLTGEINQAKKIGAEVWSKGLLITDEFLGADLVDMYGKIGIIQSACEMFNMLPVKNVVSWTALISGFLQQRHSEQALFLFKQMQLEGLTPDDVAFSCILKACQNISDIKHGIEIHEDAVTTGMLKINPKLCSSLIEMYAKCGMLEKSQDVFDTLSNQDLASWNALIEAYVQHECYNEALYCIDSMQHSCVSPNEFTVAYGLKACAGIGSIDKGIEMHFEISRMGFSEDVYIGSTLVDMYAKCGCLQKANEVFDVLPVRNMVTWNALISGYSHLGHIEEVLSLVNRMDTENLTPDSVTFMGVLNACSHSGSMDDMFSCFEVMSKIYGMTPRLNHHTCMVDLFGRAGQLDKVMEILSLTPFHPDNVMCLSTLSACRKWGDVMLGERVFECALNLGTKPSAAYISMYNIYADAHTQEAKL